ncbi:hypothetical protein BAUCODRAFT_573541 [Baudoinia panamericana UAMH 10762]|uniref:Calcineurin-like phosphoesterase domain-containing protein n=1 Tax=Baudoinia panamericana (strain UAMH 10762) TaxID=717646 RepID=M2NIN6_BAUPA|nr:uncharacterized protein BAUCODRAFT_573541 [Baudoinia panamericana UAMH 10762]EMC99254.1 hypothetical protein BAUCODRAFT_573541 [Baudoinia panamericana UAMH 10762]
MQRNGTYGLAQAGDFDGTRFRGLAPSLLPGGVSDPNGERRLVFVGDIHGCKGELSALLRAVGFDTRRDHLIATGDVVSKGPDSLGVLDLLIQLGAESVRGNHEDRLLETYKTLRKSSETLPDTASQVESAATTSHGYHKDAVLLRQMKPAHLKYLREMPLMLRIPSLPQVAASTSEYVNHAVLVAHAGIVPHVSLERQDPYFVMNMRTIDRETHLPCSQPVEGPKDTKVRWFILWDTYQTRLLNANNINVPLVEPMVVVYGHDSKQGLQLHQWSRGLDSACVAGGRLTAMVLDAKGKEDMFSVPCQEYKV